MGLFSKTVTCAKCGAEFEKGLLSGGTLCPRCSLEESENRMLAGNAQAFREGFLKYYKAMPGKFRNLNVDIQAAIQNTEQIIQKYASTYDFSQELIRKAVCNFEEMSEGVCTIFPLRFKSSIMYNKGFSTAHTSFILSHGYPGVILDFEKVFAAAYKPVDNFMINTDSKEQAYALYFFSNDPFVPALGMTVVVGSTLGAFSFGSDKRNREDTVKEMLKASCTALTYPIQTIKDLKKQIKSEGTVKGSIAPDFMMALVEQAEKEKGVMNDVEEVTRNLYSGMVILMKRNGFLTEEYAAADIDAMDRDAQNFWKPYFAVSAPELLHLFR